MRRITACFALILASGLACANPAGEPAEIVARSMPALTEASWTFDDGGNTYFVGKTTGRIVVIRGGEVEPEKPRPKPPPVPAAKARWLSVVVDPASPEQAAWRTNSEFRQAVEAAGIEFRTYLATESEIQTLGFQQFITAHGLPLVVIQDDAGKLVKAVSPKNVADLISIIEAVK